VPIALLAIVPAVIVGLAVYLLAGGGSSNDDRAASVIDGFIRFNPPEEGETVTTYRNEFPPNFPAEFPEYSGADIVASFATASQQGTIYFAALSMSDAPDEVYQFFFENLDTEPWQVEYAQASDELTAIVFTRPDNPDIEGQVRIHRAEFGGDTTMFISMPDLGQTDASAEAKPFVLSASRTLPPGFPDDVPIYEGDASVVLETAIQRSAGNNIFFISFLTKDSQTDVLNFYRRDFQGKGWTVTDSDLTANNFSLGIDFQDGVRQEISGSVAADSFAEDSSYTRVDLQLQVSARRGRTN
jgi:hypothetical protein